jgi:hypothetical protein
MNDKDLEQEYLIEKLAGRLPKRINDENYIKLSEQLCRMMLGRAFSAEQGDRLISIIQQRIRLPNDITLSEYKAHKEKEQE